MLKCSYLSEVTIYGIQSGPMSNVISAIQACRFLRKGCETFLALVLNSNRGQVNMEDILMTKEFLDVFLKELSGLPPEREVNLAIEFVHGMTPIFRAPYRMAPTKLRVGNSTTGAIGQGICPT